MDLASGYGMGGDQLSMILIYCHCKKINYFDCKIIQMHLLVGR
jgi:hypothetical protein